ncbi:MAG: S8 family serine peptidase, partial [Candidatus Eisenbacteria bacterium]
MLRARTAVLAAFLAFSLASAAIAAVGAPVPGELIVKYKLGTGPTSRAQALARVPDAQPLRELAIINAQQVRFSGIPMAEAIARLRQDPAVVYAEPNYEIHLDRVPNDPRFGELYAMRNVGQTGGTPGADIRATSAWDLFTGDPEVKVGVIDTGIDFNHPDLAANIWTNPGEIAGNGIDDDHNGYVDDIHGYDFVNNDGSPMDDNGHGTHCSGTIAGVGDNGIGVAGVSWRCKLVGIKFLSSGGSGTTAAAIQSVQYAVAVGVRLTSNSWGGGEFSTALFDAIQAAGASGQLFVAAAGNSGSDNDLFPHYPASYNSPFIISVAATDDSDQMAGFSCFGRTSVDLGAPGVDILSTFPGASYNTLSGTSMATPHVSGAVAMIMGRFPLATNLQARDILLSSTDSIPALAGRTVTGGRLNLLRAIQLPDSLPPASVADLAIGEAGSTAMGLTWTVPADDGPDGHAAGYDLRWSLAPIDEANFAAAQHVATPLAGALGQTEHLEVPGLSPDTHYWFALRALDRVGNASALSNVVEATTLGVPAMALDPGSFSASLLTGGSASFPLTVRNTGAGRLDFSAPTPEQFVAILNSAADGGGDPEAAFDRSSAGPRPGFVGGNGPDAGGYRWADSDHAGGPAFEWVDLAGRGVPVPFANSGALSQPIDLGFEFPYYGGRFRTLRVSTSGYLTFTGSAARAANSVLPDAGLQGDLVAPLWGALALGAGGSVESSREDGRFVVTFRALVGREPADGLHTFQVVLYPSGELRYQYLTLGAARDRATVGMQAAGRAVGSLVAFNTPFVHDRQAIQFLPVQQWLQVTPASGRLASGASTQLTVRFDATGLAGGDLLGNVIIDSNDPAAAHVPLPAALHVTAAPDLVASPDSLEFAPLFIGAERVQQLTLLNRGTAPLQISGLSISPADYAAPTSAMTLFPGNSVLVPVTFRPTVAGPITGALIVHSDDPDSPDHAVQLAGTGLVPPDVALAPDSVLASLFVGGTATRTLTITNSGGSELQYRLSSRRPAGATAPAGEPIAAPESKRVADANRLHAADAAPAIHALYAGANMAFGVSLFGEIMPFQSPVGVEHLQAGTFLSGYTLAYQYGGGERLAFSVFSGGSGLVPVAYRERENTAARVVVEVTTATTDGALQVVRTITFERAGHGVRVETRLRNTSGLTLPGVIYKEDVDWDADGSFPNTWNYDLTRNLVYASDVHFVGIGSDRAPDFMDADGWDDFARSGTSVGIPAGPVTGLDGLALLHFALGSLPAGDSSTVAVAYGAGNTLAELQDAIDANASSVPWLSFEPHAGTVGAGQSLQVAARLNAAGLLDGDYHADIELASNDPDEPTLNAGAHLHVTGAADIVAVPTSLDFGYLFAGASKSDTVTVTNAGTAALVVSGVSASPAEFLVPAAGFTLAPGEARRIPVRFAPPLRGDFRGAVTIASNDPDEGSIPIAVHGFGRVPPDIQLPLDSLLADLITGETRVHTLQLDNTGGGELFWDATVGPRTVLEATPVFGSSAPTLDKQTATSAPPAPAKDQQYRAAVPAAALPEPLYPAEAALAGNTLESTLSKLDAGAAEIAATVPDSYPFSEGVFGNSISDGGGDMYDGGNFLSTPFGGLNYSDGVIQTSATFGTGGRYFTRKYPGLFVLAAEMQDVTAFTISGNLGADGFGNVDGSILQIRAADATYRAFVKRVFNAGDPSVNHMVIVADDPAATHSFALNTDDDFHQVTGLAPARRLYYLLYAGTGGRIDDAQAMQVFATFLRVLDPQPTWLRLEPS